METYETLKVIHVLAAAIWVGGALVMQVLDFRVARAGPDRLAESLEDAEAVGYRIFIPASLVALLAGLGLLFDGGWGLEPWIVFGLGVFAFSFLVGVLYFGPEVKRILALIERSGPRAAEVATRMRRYHVVARVEDYLLVLVLAAMVLKPTL